jgi:hypothetical protein
MTVILAASLFAFAGSLDVGQPVGRIPPACLNSTVADAWGPAYAKTADAFLAEIKASIASDDGAAFARLVKYPLEVHSPHRSKTYRDSRSLLRDYARIVTQEFRRKVASQRADCLFGNAEGVMVGDGEIWFARVDGRMQIVSLNVG